VKIMAVPFAALEPLTAYSLWKLRQDVFVVEQKAAYADLDGRDLDPDTRHVVMDDDDVVVGCARVLDDGDTWRIGRVALHPTVRGKGLADALLQTALQVCKDRDVVLDAQEPLAAWYGSFGFVEDGAMFLDDGIPHVPMRLAR